MKSIFFSSTLSKNQFKNVFFLNYKKQFISVAILLFWFSNAFTQEEEKLSGLFQNFDYQEVENGLNSFEKIATEKTKYKWRTNIERELVNNFFEQIIQFTKSVRSDENKSVSTIYKYNLKLIKKQNGKIALYKLYRLKNVKVNGKWTPTEIIVKEGSNKIMKELESEFLRVYSYPLNYNELFETNIVYGDVCGRVRGIPEYRGKLEKLIKSKDSKNLVKWLKSTVTEIQLYAIDGILTLKKQGIDFNKDVLKLVDVISKKKGEVYTCNRCIYSNNLIVGIILDIKNKHNSQKR
ncbi:hypothetical protein [Tenacibaculum sp. SZ-18]|uniref:hypothetical protein n=1 Tax=Tenacibaculum sp. SZ-18 TaxID=754423 RepID=UPI0012FE0CEC|nr:hypothetical protein [Tenacibaculum sp. SZ-18]